MKRKFLSILLALCMVLTLLPATALAAAPTATDSGYSDIDGHWAEEAIKKWSEYGIFQGSNGQFDPNGELTRAQAAVIFMRLLNLTEEGDISGFTDVDPEAWYAEAIAKCVAAGIMLGNGDGTMDPTGKLTREQLFVMFGRALGVEPADTCDKEFADSDSVSSWAIGYINALVNMGAIDGMGDGSMSPDKNINRASIVALLDKCVTYVTEDGATVTADGNTIVIVAAKNVTIEGDPAIVVNTTGESTEPGTDPEPDPDPTPSTPSVSSTPSIIIPSHSHTYSSEWSKDDTHHWHAATCEHTEVADKAAHEWTFVAGYVATCKNEGEKDHYTCDICEAISLKTDDTYAVVADTELVIAVDSNHHEGTLGTEYQTDEDYHWFVYSCCNAEGTKTAHSYNESTHKCVCGAVDPACVAKIDDVYYLTLADAVKYVHTLTGDARTAGTTITLLKDAEGEGIGVGYNSLKTDEEGRLVTEGTNPVKLTIDLGTYTYTVTSPAVGSKGTSTNGFQLNAGSNVTIIGERSYNGYGTIAIKADSNVKILIQNYSDLTLTDVLLDGRNMTKANNCTLSNNCGDVQISGCTIYPRNASETPETSTVWDGAAMDVYGGSGSYDDVTVTVTNSAINGKIEVKRSANNTNTNKNKLIINSGVFTGELDVTDHANTTVTIKGGSFSDLATAVKYAEANAIITMLSDVTLTSNLNIGKNLTINGNDKKVISCYTVQCDTNVVVFQNVKFENPTNASANASHVYGSGSLTFENCEFVNTQWDSIQYTPKASNSALVVKNCVFTAAAIEGSTTQPKRFIHVEPTKNNSFTLAITITGCTFNGDRNLKDDSVGLYYLAPGSTLTLGGNTFDGTPDVWICRPGNANDKPYENAADMLTGNITTYTIPEKTN